MQIKTFKELHAKIRELDPLKIVIAMADEEEVLLADRATKEGIATFTLIGNESRIQELLKKEE